MIKKQQDREEKGVRLCLVADIHHGPEHLTKKGPAALSLLQRFLDHAQEAGPDLVVDLGDRISNLGPKEDLRALEEVARVFRASGLNRAHLLGNHDLVHLTRARNEETLSSPLGNRTLDLGGWRLVFWQAGVDRKNLTGEMPIGEDLNWLAQTLASSARPTAVFSHLPLAAHSQAGNYYFEHNPEFAVCPGHEAIREVLDETVCPLVLVAAHVHWNSLTCLDGLPHVTVQSLTESFTTPPLPCGAHTDLILGSRGVEVRVHGLDRFNLSLDLPSLGPRRWQPPLGPGFSVPGDRSPEARKGAA